MCTQPLYPLDTRVTCKGKPLSRTGEFILKERPFTLSVSKEKRLEKQIRFLESLDRLKQVWRRNYVMDRTRRENSAEHSWHIAVMAMFLKEYAPPGTDLFRVLQMLLIHDVIEIEAGDTFCYDKTANLDKDEREKEAADHIFGILPEDQAIEFRALWDEFEDRKTPESRFANSMDRFQVLFQNFNTKGGTWADHDIPKSRVLERESVVRTGAPGLWAAVEDILARSVDAGFLRDDT